MKKIVILVIAAAVSLLASKAGYDANCAGCHGADGKMKALDKSALLAGMGAGAIDAALKGYKAGKINKYGEGASMSASIAALSDADLKSIADYAGGLK